MSDLNTGQLPNGPKTNSEKSLTNSVCFDQLPITY